MAEPATFADAIRADTGKRVTIELIGGAALWVTVASDQPKTSDFIALDIENAVCTAWLPILAITSVRDGWHETAGLVRLKPL